jgi:hypothetical protein
LVLADRPAEEGYFPLRSAAERKHRRHEKRAPNMVASNRRWGDVTRPNFNVSASRIMNTVPSFAFVFARDEICPYPTPQPPEKLRKKISVFAVCYILTGLVELS